MKNLKIEKFCKNLKKIFHHVRNSNYHLSFYLDVRFYKYVEFKTCSIIGEKFLLMEKTIAILCKKNLKFIFFLVNFRQYHFPRKLQYFLNCYKWFSFAISGHQDFDLHTIVALMY